MLCNPTGKDSVVAAVQPENAELPMLVTLSGISIFASFEQLEKQVPGIAVRFAESRTDTKAEQD